MPVYTIDGAEVEVPEGMSQEQATSIFRQSQQTSEEVATQQQQQQSLAGVPTGGTPRAMSQPEQSRFAEDFVRTGIPAIGAFATKSPWKFAALLGLSELTADEIKELQESPNYKDGMDYFKKKAESVVSAGTAAGMAFAGDRYILPWLRKQGQEVKRWALLPREMGRDVEKTQRFFGRAYRASTKPYSLTLDQLHQGQETLIEQAGSMARSSFGGGSIMRAADKRNIDAIDNWVDVFMRTGRETTPERFGNALKVLLNQDTAYVTHQTNHLFNQYRNMVYRRGIEVDISSAFNYLKENMDNRFARQILSKVVRSDPAIAEKIKGGERLLTMTDDEIEQVFASMPYQQAQQLIDSMIHTFPVETVTDMYHNLNRMFGKAKEGGIRKFANEFKQNLDVSLKSSLDAVNREAYPKFREAMDFAAKQGERNEKKIIGTVFKRLGDEQPAALVSMFEGTNALDNYRMLKKFFDTSDVLTARDFEHSVVEPLRYDILNRGINPDTELFEGPRLGQALDTLKKNNGTEFLDEIFGPEVAPLLRDAATGLNVISKTKKASIVMKIIQAGALASGTGAILYGDAPPIQQVAFGTVAILFAPRAVAKMFSDPRNIKLLMNGIEAGPGSPGFARLLMAVGLANRESIKEIGGMSPEAQEFYGKVKAKDEEPERRLPEPILPMQPGMLKAPSEI